MKRFLLVLLILVIPLSLLACGTKEAKTDKTIRVGTGMVFPPFEFIEDREKGVVGFDIDIMNAVGKELGYEVVYQDIDFDDLLNVLEKGNVDVVISGLSITEEREVRVNFTKPYYETGIAIAVMENNKNIRNFTDLPGKKVAVVAGSVSALEVREQRSIDAVELPTTADTFQALLSGKADAVLNDKAVIDYYLNTNTGIKIKILPELHKKEHYGIAVGKNDKELLEQIDNALQKIKDKGVYDKIYDKWFGEKAL